MAGKKISQLNETTPQLSGVTVVVQNNTSFKSTLNNFRKVLVDSGSHFFTGSQFINGDVEVTGGLYISGAYDAGLYLGNTRSIFWKNSLGDYYSYMAVEGDDGLYITARGDNGLKIVNDGGILFSSFVYPAFIHTGSVIISGSLNVEGPTTFIGNQTFKGNLVVSGALTAQQYILSSSVTNMVVESISGSTAFGNSLDDTHIFTGSVLMSGSLGLSGSFNHGLNSNASGLYSHVQGNTTLATGNYSHAEGYFTTASGYASHAKGRETKATGNYSSAEGWNTTASSAYSHAEGRDSIASGQNSHAEGEYTYATAQASHAEGYASLASNIGAHAEGWGTIASGLYSNTKGYYTIASGDFSIAYGSSSWAIGTGSHAEGKDTIAYGAYSHTEGSATFTSPIHSNIVSVDTINNIIEVGNGNAFLVGHNIAYVYEAAGNGNKVWRGAVLGKNANYITASISVEDIDTSTWWGLNETGSTLFNLSSGSGVSGNGLAANLGWMFAHAEGSYNLAAGYNSHAEGRKNAAIANHSHAEGTWNVASGLASHAEGGFNISSGTYSHAEGLTNFAIGRAAHAEGNFTSASGDYSHAEGFGTIASGSYQHAQGTYNLISTQSSAFIIGNGTSNVNRSNLVFASGSSFQITGSANVSGGLILQGTLQLTGSVSVSASQFSIYGSGSATPIFSVNGSLGQILTVYDELTGSLWSINDASGLPVFEANSDSRIFMGNYLAPILMTSVKTTLAAVNDNIVYSNIPTSSYNLVHYDYVINSGSNWRAGKLSAMWNNASTYTTESINFNVGVTTGVTYTVNAIGGNLILSASATTPGWISKFMITAI